MNVYPLFRQGTQPHGDVASAAKAGPVRFDAPVMEPPRDTGSPDGLVARLKSLHVERLLAGLSRGIRRAHPAVLVSLAVAFFAIVFGFSVNGDLRSQLDALDAQLAEAAARAQAASGAQPGSAAALIASLPARDDLPRVLALVERNASANGIELAQGAYSVRPGQEGGLSRFVVELPVTGPYLDIRRFVDGVLADVPSATLENIRLERKKVADRGVEAEVRFAILLREAP